jgi:hypothetical protein
VARHGVTGRVFDTADDGGEGRIDSVQVNAVALAPRQQCLEKGGIGEARQPARVLAAVLFELDFAATLSLQGEVKAKRYFLAFVLASFPCCFIFGS